MRTIFLRVAALAAALLPQALVAQQASPYIPIEHWAMPFVEHLISAGIIVDPTPDTRPFKQSALLHALESADTTHATPGVRATIRRLIAEWSPRETLPHYRVEPSLGAQAATFAFRDPLELDRGACTSATQCVIQTPGHAISDHTFGNIGANVEFFFGHVVAVTDMEIDTRLDVDPDWYAIDNTATRFQEAYVNAQWSAGELFFGILDRNWGPSVVQGLLLSPNPYSIDHFAATVGSARVQLQTWVAELDPRTDSTGTLQYRYMMQNRLWIHPPGRWTLALGAAAVTAGPGDELDFWDLNPATIAFFRTDNGLDDSNSFLDVDFERKARVTTYGQFMIDDIQVSRNGGTDLKPASLALTLGAKGGSQSGGASWVLFYTQVDALTYHNEVNEEVPEYFGGQGIGRQFDDYDQVTAQVNLLCAPTFLLQPEVDVVRQGQGDPHLLHPLPAQYPTLPVLFDGVVERIVHVALGGSWQLQRFTVTGTAGLDFIQNANNIAGASQTPFLGSIAVTYHLHHEARLP